MTDIVERLRLWSKTNDAHPVMAANTFVKVLDEAAAEIERLRAQIKKLRAEDDKGWQRIGSGTR